MNTGNKKNKVALRSSKNKSKKSKQKKQSGGNNLSAFFMRSNPFVKVLLTMLLIVLISTLLISTVSSVYAAAYVNGTSKVNLDYYKTNQDQTSIIYALNKDKKYVEVASLHGEENRKWVDLDKIPKDVQNAFIALEDKRFAKHKGVDWVRLAGVMIKHKFSQGGSTITQQLIKNLTGENDVIISRKLHEILQALNLEKNYEKEQILEAYLNTIPLGSGCYGVQTASEKYFNKDVSQLNAAEGAVLASITKAPTFYNPLLNPDNNRKRQQECLRQMEKQNYLTKEQYQQMKDYKIKFNTDDKKTKDKKPVVESSIHGYYVDYIIDSLIKDLVNAGFSNQEAVRLVYYGGLKIYSTIEIDSQKKVEDIFINRKGFGSNNIQAAITIMNYEGQIVAMVGGAGPKTVNRGLNRAVDAVRQPGSSIKPLSVYAPSLEKNRIHFSSMLTDYAITKDGKPWPQNANGSFGDPDKKVTVQYALQNSLNTTAVRLALDYGARNSLRFLTEKFHFNNFVKTGKNTDANLSSMGVGGTSRGVTTLEMAAAYAAFGNGGKYYKPYVYTKVTDNTGKKVYIENKDQKGEQIMEESTAYIMNQLLQTVATRGTGRLANVSGFETFIKTGTTSDFKDEWSCGGTPYYVGAVWYGYDQPARIPTGATARPSRILGLSLTELCKGRPSKKFVMPSDVVRRNYYPSTGLLVKDGDSTASTMVGYYKKNHLPDEGEAEEEEETTTTDPDEDDEDTTDSENTETTTTTETTSSD
ncbi:MAG: transglycosylase domain-containing protein [Clostridia bacterium]|nr:transglycosylase domain-containing protein [Clostridia bacterium]